MGGVVSRLRRPRGALAPRVLAAVLAALMLLSATGRAEVPDAPRSPEYVIKAAYLYNFAMFVEWPQDAFANAEAPLVIGVLGADPFGGALERIVEGKRINKRRIVIQRVQSVQEARRCQILFVSVDDDPRVPELTGRLEGASVLLVGESETMIGRGGSISFNVRDNKVGYDVNLDAARKARLTISSKLLNLARAVRRS
jgi:hypothetical protein